MSGQSDPRLSPMKLYKRRGGVTRDFQNGDNGVNIQAMVSYHYFISHQVKLLGVSDNFVGKKLVPCPHEYIFQTPMNWIPYPTLDL